MLNRPTYVLAAVVIGGMRLKRFRIAGEDGPAGVLEHPPTIRWAGFDLNTLDTARLVTEDCLEVRSGDDKVIQLYQNSHFLARFAADDELLGWGVDRDVFERDPLLNPVACVEIHAAFCQTYAKLLSFAESPPALVRMHAALRNARVGNKYLSMTPYYKNRQRVPLPEKFPAHDDNVDADFTIPADSLLANPNAIAYQFVAKFAAMFDMPESKLPFVSDTQTGREVDVAKIAAL